jgi:hypothetical protein
MVKALISVSLVSVSLTSCELMRPGLPASQTRHPEDIQETLQVASMEQPSVYARTASVRLLSSPRGPKTKGPESQDKKATRVYVIRVIDEISGRPVTKAVVTVELLAMSDKSKWLGRTNSRGVFTFTWEPNTRSVRAHILVQAPGFWSVDDDNVLVEERIIQLKKEN